MNLLILLILLIFLVAPVTPATLFVISGDVTCTLNRRFEYRILVYEDDRIPLNELLLRTPIFWATESPHFYNITTSDTDDGILNNYYELSFQVLHNCNSLGEDHNLNARFILGDYPITHGTHYISFNINITDKGTTWKRPI